MLAFRCGVGVRHGLVLGRLLVVPVAPLLLVARNLMATKCGSLLSSTRFSHVKSVIHLLVLAATWLRSSEVPSLMSVQNSSCLMRVACMSILSSRQSEHELVLLVDAARRVGEHLVGDMLDDVLFSLGGDRVTSWPPIVIALELIALELIVLAAKARAERTADSPQQHSETNSTSLFYSSSSSSYSGHYSTNGSRRWHLRCNQEKQSEELIQHSHILAQSESTPNE